MAHIRKNQKGNSTDQPWIPQKKILENLDISHIIIEETSCSDF